MLRTRDGNTDFTLGSTVIFDSRREFSAEEALNVVLKISPAESPDKETLIETAYMNGRDVSFAIPPIPCRVYRDHYRFICVLRTAEGEILARSEILRITVPVFISQVPDSTMKWEIKNELFHSIGLYDPVTHQSYELRSRPFQFESEDYTRLQVTFIDYGGSEILDPEFTFKTEPVGIFRDEDSNQSFHSIHTLLSPDLQSYESSRRNSFLQQVLYENIKKQREASQANLGASETPSRSMPTTTQAMTEPQGSSVSVTTTPVRARTGQESHIQIISPHDHSAVVTPVRESARSSSDDRLETHSPTSAQPCFTPNPTSPPKVIRRSLTDFIEQEPVALRTTRGTQTEQDSGTSCTSVTMVDFKRQMSELATRMQEYQRETRELRDMLEEYKTIFESRRNKTRTRKRPRPTTQEGQLCYQVENRPRHTFIFRPTDTFYLVIYQRGGQWVSGICPEVPLDDSAFEVLGLKEVAVESTDKDRRVLIKEGFRRTIRPDNPFYVVHAYKDLSATMLHSIALNRLRASCVPPFLKKEVDEDRVKKVELKCYRRRFLVK